MKPSILLCAVLALSAQACMKSSPRTTVAPVIDDSIRIVRAGDTISPLTAQTPRPDSLQRPRRGAEILLPLGSVFVPGLGQYAHGELKRGLAYSAVAVGGVVVGRTGDSEGESWAGDLPRRPRDQLAEQGEDVALRQAFSVRGIPFTRQSRRCSSRGSTSS